MRKDLIIKGRSLGGASDLTLLAPLREGLVPSLEAASYRTRTKRLLKALNAGRALSHEHALLRPFSDAVERIGKIHSVRVAVFEPDDKVLLSVTFDGAWEAYLRVLWQKTGRLLDAIFCNTQDYVSAWDHSYDEWCAWAQRVQTETAFFYGTPSHTVDDVQYLRDAEQRTRRAADSDRDVLRSRVPSAELRAYAQREVEPPATYPEVFRQGLQTVVGLHRLADVYLPGSPDGAFLERAAVELLQEFGAMLWGPSPQFDESLAWARARYGRQLDWFRAAWERPLPSVRRPPPLPDRRSELPAFNPGNVQGGILERYRHVSHGALVLLAFDEPAAAGRFLRALPVTSAADSHDAADGSLLCNLALSVEGLRRLGLSEAELERFPREFLEGMEARASQLGDVRGNHPRRWRLPQPNWPAPAGPDTPPIDLRAVHAVLQWRVLASVEIAADVGVDDPAHPLHAHLQALADAWPGVRILAVQPMQRLQRTDDGAPREHFGFADGMSDPTITPQPGPGYRNQVHLGELLLGHDNAADRAPAAHSDPAGWLREGSFLVVRKLRQDVERFDALVDKAAADTALGAELIRAKMMGRQRDGKPLVPGTSAGDNGFGYQRDPAGSACPFHAHIRRANPRGAGDPAVPEAPGGRMPRIVRRGMPYGPKYDAKAGGNAAQQALNAQERGLIFMAYNASIGEQFEVIQRWLSGGNSSGSYSGVSDPFLGVPENGRQRWFRFEHAGAVVRIGLDGTDAPLHEPQPIVRLEWGAYLFTPSLTGLRRLADRAEAGAVVPASLPWSVQEGAQQIAQLQALASGQGEAAARLAWKAALEDPDAQERFSAASIWAAIRERHDGVLRTPYGVLVADRELVMQVFANPQQRYSVAGYLPRMRNSIGPIYLGLDDGAQYQAEAAAANAELQAIDPALAFDTAREATRRLVSRLVQVAQQRASELGETRWEMVLDGKEVAEELLAVLCEEWFGLGEADGHWRRGGARWDWQDADPPLYPGHFTAPSRCIFQPRPGDEVFDYAQRYGRRATQAMTALVGLWRGAPDRVPPLRDARNAAVRAALRAALLDGTTTRADDAAAARMMVGVLMGMVPTLDAALRLMLNEWLREGTFWSLRAAVLTDPPAGFAGARARLARPLTEAMQLRPAPELVWRTAVQPHTLGLPERPGVDIAAGEIVVVSIVSAMQHNLEQGRDDRFAMFGGERTAGGPTHACPAYGAAMGVLLGALTALLQAPGAMRPGPGPLTLMFEGSFVPPAEMRRRPVPQRPSSSTPPPLAGAVTPAAQSVRTLLAWGDSWVHYPNNLCEALRATGNYRIEGSAQPGRPLGRLGLSLREMAQGGQLDAFSGLLADMLRAGERPAALLLSGGGNDAVRDRLARMLEKRSDVQGIVANALIADQVCQLVDVELRGHWTRIFDTLATAWGSDHSAVPVLVHGYDRPVPDGRNLTPSPRFSWLWYPITEQRGWNVDEGRTIMQSLIRRLNDLLGELAKQYPFVVHVDLQGTLRNAAPGYLQDWDNELHPVRDGFAALAAKIDAAIPP